MDDDELSATGISARMHFQSRRSGSRLASPRGNVRPGKSPELQKPLLTGKEQHEAGSDLEAAGGAGGGEGALAGHVKAAMYGVINAVVVAPVMIGFAAIIFRHPSFHTDPAVYASLVKLVIFSSMVHQFSFSTFSSLPFSIGQVQDAGLIFLSKIAGDLADATSGESLEVRMATVLVALSMSTLLLGVALVVTGKLRLAMLVQYLPLPVVGGYLAFIGLYCLEAGLTLMSGVQVTSLLGFDCVAQWRDLFQPASLLAILPGVLSGVAILLILQRFHHFLVLPSILLFIPLAFFAVAFAAGYGLDELRADGWVAAQEPSTGGPLEVFRFFRFGLVRWELLPALWPTWLGMYVVVAFSSSLDVAAIQMDMGKQLDFNHELITVGISNALSGVTGGFTGSYIFSQTIFTFRTGTNSRACGAVVIVAELVLFALPFSIVSYIPKLFFGAVLTFIAVDLMFDWLVRSRAKVHPAEYAIIWATFALINLVGLELGMACGVLAAMAQFILDYARVPVVQRVSLRSNVMRSPTLSQILADMQPRIIQLRLRGYVFFGSTIQIMDDVMGSVVLPEPPDSLTASRDPSVHGAHGRAAPVGGGAGAEPTRFVVFDFTMVSGLDATAARSCFLNLCRTLAPSGISVVFGGVLAGSNIDRLLIGHEILGEGAGETAAYRFDSIDEALEYCEEQLLRSSVKAQKTQSFLPPAGSGGGGGGGGAIPRHSSAERLGQVLATLVEPSWSDMMAGLAPFFEERAYLNGQTIFRRGEEALCIYFIITGEVTLYEYENAAGPSAAPSASAAALRGLEGPPASTPPNQDQGGRRLVRYVNGGIFGELDFFLRNLRSFNAVATSDGCTILLLTRDALQSMQTQSSQLAAALEHAVLKYLCFQVNNKLGLSDGICDIRETIHNHLQGQGSTYA